MQVVETKNEGLCREFKITLLAAEIEEKIEERIKEEKKKKLIGIHLSHSKTL